MKKQNFILMNQLSVCFDVGRVIGYGEDESDCYLIIKYPQSGRFKDNKIVWHTFVGGYTYLNRLKGQGYVKANTGEDWDDFTRLDSFLSLNDCPKEEEFKVVLRTDDPLDSP